MIRKCDQPSLITPYMLLGDSTVNENPELVQVYGITHIINMAHKLKPNCRLMYDRCIVYEHIKSEDRLGYSIRPHFEEAFELIDHARCTGGRVLVHCKGGKSRSATIVIAYLMSRYQMPLFFAFNYVKQCRKVIQPNPSFSYALECYDQELSRLRTARGSCGGSCCYMVTAYRNLRFLEALTYSSTIPQPFINSLRLTIKDIFGH